LPDGFFATKRGCIRGIACNWQRHLPPHNVRNAPRLLRRSGAVLLPRASHRSQQFNK
jgi:hypothetical protein